MLLHHLLLLALLLALLLFGVVVFHFHSNELPSTRLAFRRQGGSAATVFNSSVSYPDNVHQQLERLEASHARLRDELLGMLGSRERNAQGGSLQRLESLQSQINQLHHGFNELSQEQNKSQELSRIYLAIEQLEKRMSKSHSDYQSGLIPGKFKVESIRKSRAKDEARRGVLMCGGKQVDSEVIYWRIVPGDANYESPYRRRNGENKKFLTFKYDPAGYNNMRMSFESLAVLAHAMGRVFVLPPDNDHEELIRPQSQQDLKIHAEMHRNASADMGFEDIFNMELLRSHGGFSTMTMGEFIESEAKAGHIKGIYPPPFAEHLRGDALWTYLISIADVSYGYNPKFFVFDDHDDYLPVLMENSPPGPMRDRLFAFFGQDEAGRGIVNYNKANEYFNVFVFFLRFSVSSECAADSLPKQSRTR